MLLHGYENSDSNAANVILVNPSHVASAYLRPLEPGVVVNLQGQRHFSLIVRGSLLQFYSEWTNAMNETGYARDDQEMYLDRTS